jgi:DNA repair protein RecN (Recombination protein N)
MADRHFRVDKQVIDQPLSRLQKQLSNEANGEVMLELDEQLLESKLPDIRTVVRVSLLDNIAHRREEIAQLAGGQSAREAMIFAESLLTQAASWRQN